MGQFSHVSLLVELDYERWFPRAAAFLDTAHYFPRRSRTLVHESLHYWQQLSHGYLFALAQEDWQRMLAWEHGGQPAMGPLRDRYRQPDGRHRFSVHDLCESVARFWEVLFIGPEAILRDAVTEARSKSLSGDVPPGLKKLASQEHIDSRAFGAAMDLSGSYGVSFAVVRALVGQRDGLVIFPFLAHFALKTMQPVHFFERFVDELASVIVKRAEALGLATSWNQYLAATLYPFVSSRCEEVVRHAGESGLLHAPALFRDSPLQENPAYLWSFRRRESLGVAVGGLDTADLAICLPAFSDFRKLLALFLTPPCVRFRDRQALGLAAQYAAAPVGASAEEVSIAQTAMTECLSLQERWTSFQDALRRY